MAPCIHHFMIEPQIGPTSLGVCKFCGDSRTFQNSWKDSKPMAGGIPPRLSPSYPFPIQKNPPKYRSVNKRVRE